MDVVIPRKDLYRILEQTHAVADRKSAVPALANVLLTADGATLVAQATDLYLSMRDECAADVTASGALALPAKDLFERVKAMPDGPIQIREEGAQAILSAVGGKRRYMLHALPGADFPPLPKPVGDAWELSADVLRALMTATHFSISSDETRAHVNSALFEWSGDRVRMVTTDGHRLSEIELPAPSERMVTMLIPQKGITALRRFVDVKGAVLTIQQGGPCAFFTLGSATFSVKLVDAQFPPYQQVIPKSVSRSVNVSRISLIDALKAVQIAASERTGGVTLHFGADSLRIESESPESGNAADELPISPTGAGYKVGVNAKYLLDALGAIDADEAAIGVSGELDPLTVKAAGSDDFIACVMPMRTG